MRSTPSFNHTLAEPVDRAAQPAWVASLTRKWWIVMCVALMGYAVQGKGFAYIGLPPIFVAEVMMLSGVGCLLICGRWWQILRMPQMMLLTLFFAWCFYRTVPYLRSGGIDAVKDGIIYVYSLFTYAIAGVLICQPKLIPPTVQWYKKYFFPVFLICTPFTWTAFQLIGEGLPRWPWVEMTVIYLKAGDLQVHLGGILGFWASEVAGATAIYWFVPMFINAALLGPVNRGGMMAFLSSIASSLIFHPFNRWAWSFIGIAFFGLSLLFITQLEVKIPGTERPISFDQLVQNFTSIAGGGSKSDDAGDLQGTKEWRLQLWANIFKDCLHGEYFWTGMGFGENIVDHYNMNVDEDKSVRDPHNGHISVLARTGVPGSTMWILIHFTWAAGMIDGYVRSVRAQRKEWAGLFMWMLIYWLMIVINCSFDPYIEGPMGAVWLWSVYGVGIAAIWLRGRNPDLFEPAPEPQAEPDALAEMSQA